MLAPRQPPLAELLKDIERVRRWCLLRTGDAHLAEDIAQETALAALRLRMRPTSRVPASMRAWLFRVAQRRLADALRRRRPEQPLRDEPFAPLPPGAPERVEAEAEARALALRIRKALRALPCYLRRPVRLHYLKGRSIREVAARCSTTVNSIKSRLYRARCILREKGAR